MLITHVKQKTNPKYLDILKVLPNFDFFLVVSFQINVAKNQTYLVSTTTC